MVPSSFSSSLSGLIQDDVHDMPTSFSTSSSLPPSEALSTLLGSISLACWVVLLLPQIVENYANRSASAVSLPFLLLWSAGDICNLIGAVWAGVVVNTVIAVGVYWCVTDSVVVGQWLYYYSFYDKWGRKADRKENAVEEGRGEEVRWQSGQDQRQSFDRRTDEVEEEERQPLLAEQPRSRKDSDNGSIDCTTPSNSTSMTNSASQPHKSNSPTLLLDDVPKGSKSSSEQGGDWRQRKLWLINTLSVLGVIVAGTVGWAVAWYLGTWNENGGNNSSSGGQSNVLLRSPAAKSYTIPLPRLSPDLDTSFSKSSAVAARATLVSETTGSTTNTPVGAEILGYLSALAYLSARIPQIIKNARNKTCEGMQTFPSLSLNTSSKHKNSHKPTTILTKIALSFGMVRMTRSFPPLLPPLRSRKHHLRSQYPHSLTTVLPSC